jgi:hypothetical protein
MTFTQICYDISYIVPYCCFLEHVGGNILKTLKTFGGSYGNLMGAPWEPFGNLVITLLGHFGNAKTLKLIKII